MAGSQVGVLTLTFLFSIFFLQVFSSPVNIPIQSVSDLLIQSALNSLNEDSPTHHTYKGGNLINAQKLLEPPYVVYRLTLNLEPVCSEESASCPREACAIDLKQHELGVIEVQRNSIQCMYLYPQSAQDGTQQIQENIQESNFPEQDIVESIDRQIINETVQLDHEVQTAADQNDKPQFIAVRASNLNYCPGCPYELNPTLPGLSAFGEEVVQAMDEAAGNDFKHKLVSIVRVTRAVPPGSNVIQYQLLLEIGETNCLKTTLVERSECFLQTNVPIKLCQVTFEERTWKENSRRMTRNNCTDLSNGENEVNVSLSPTGESPRSDNLRKETTIEGNPAEEAHRQLVLQAENAGTMQSLADKLFESPVVTAGTARSEAESTAPPITEPAIIKIQLSRDSTEQVLGGFQDKLKEFDAFLEDFNVPVKIDITTSPSLGTPVTEEIIRAEQVHEHEPSADINTDDAMQVKKALEPDTELRNAETASSTSRTSDRDSSEESSESVESGETRRTAERKKRSAISTPESEKNLVMKLAQKAIDTLDDIDPDNKKRVILQILDSKKQISHGIIYHVTVKVASTACAEKLKKEEHCLGEIDGPIRICKLRVHVNEKQQLRSAKVLQSECYDERVNGSTRVRRRRQAVGSPNAISIDDPFVKEYTQLGLSKFSLNSEGTNEPILVEVVEASRQVVSGMLYKIKVKLGNSNCPKGTKKNCQLKADSEIKECLFTIWSQPWLDKGSPDIKINCNASNRRKRSLRGVNYSGKMLEQAKSVKAEKAFAKFVQMYGKSYPTKKEMKYRFNVFRENMNIVEVLRKNEQGTAKYGATIFADLTPAEFKARHLGLRPELRSQNEIPIPVAKIPNIELPKEFDWRDHNVVTEVKDQGSCGSCWAFSVTGNVEGQYAIKHGKLLSLSEQELLDCDTLDDGCNGGMPDNAYRAVENLGGLELESDYPYEAENEKCHFNKGKARVVINSAVNITRNETQMAQWLVKNGPISIGINANAMQFYFGGVSHPLKFLCSPDDLDHGVLIVGYGIHTYPIFHKKMPYWIIKNSWGARWGEQGYYRVYRGDGTCGVNQMASSAVVA